MLTCRFVARRSAPKKRKPGRPPRHATDASEQRFPESARVIKRYGNRRLYDARLSRCVTMNEIGDFVRKGEDVRVLDGDTGEDLTKRVLTQIILEESNARQLELLPLALLRKIIEARSDAAVRWLDQFLGASAQFLNRQVNAAGGGLDSLFPWMKGGAWPPVPPSETAPRSETTAADPLRSEVEELQRRMAELSSRMHRR